MPEKGLNMLGEGWAGRGLSAIGARVDCLCANLFCTGGLLPSVKSL